MRKALLGVAFLTCAWALHAQTGSQPAGLETEWDIGVILGEIGAHAGRLGEALNRVDAKALVAKGASETYADQLESSKAQARAIEQEAKTLARNPEKLSESLKIFFRIQGLETMLGSLQEAIRRYQGPAEAEALARVAAENGVNRDRFQSYIVTLAADRERQLDVMDREAQRCRGMMAREPLEAPKNSKRK